MNLHSQININNFKSGLYVVSTPIGNLGDITFRALEVLNKSDHILCEDTRVSKKLLSRYNINSKLMIPIRFNEKKIIIVPAIIFRIWELTRKNFPKKEAVRPNDIKTKEKPKVNKMVLITTKFFFLSTSLLYEVPDM